MPWVRFDDQFPLHRKVNALSDAAYRLHVEAIFWCARNLTDGFVPAEDVSRVGSVRRPNKYVTELVRRELWIECPGGWNINDYLEFQPSKAKVESDREAAAQRQRKWKEKQHSNAVSNSVSNSVSNTVTETANAVSNSVSNSVSNAAPSRPVPSRTHGGLGAGGYVGDARENAPPPNTDPGERPTERCPRHADDPSPPACGACADARRTAERWDQQTAERRKHTKTALEHAKADQRQECEHGTAGGRFIHPDTGVSALCPTCRRAQLEAS